MSPDTAGARILVVEDEPPIRELLVAGLTRAGYDCREASNGREAIGIMEREVFDLVISDQRMPEMTGLELLEAVVKQDRQTAFMMITGEDNIRIGVDAMKKGAVDYLVKPFQLDAVIVSVKRAVTIRRMNVELEDHRKNLERKVEERTRQLQAAMKRIELTYDETLAALGSALDLRDTETAGHSERVSRYCLEIAKTMDCTPEQLKQIARGSYLHDIGKIGIPDAILLKEGKLSPEEIAVMQTHSRLGYDMVCRIAFLAGAAEIVLTHQERFDGTGYPQGLIGEEIPLGARIFAVADTLDAMTSDRPYRRALPFATAKAEITRESGHQFEPRVVDTFLSLSEDIWEKIRLEVAGRRAQSDSSHARPKKP